MHGATTMTDIYRNYIDGEWCDSVSGRLFDNINPADTREVVSRHAASDARDAEAVRATGVHVLQGGGRPVGEVRATL